MFSSLRQLHGSIFILALANGVIMTGFMMVLPLLPRYANELGFSEFQIGLLIASFFVGRVLFEFPVGILSDYVGRRLIMWAALFLFAATTAAYAVTTTAEVMMALRLLSGIAASAFAVGSQAYINDWTPFELRGLANGVNSSAINAGVVAGPLLAGALSQAYSIRTPFWAGGAMGAACFVGSLFIPGAGTGRPRSRGRFFLLKQAGIKRLLGPVFCLPAFSLSLVHFLQWMGVAIFLTMAPIITAEKLGWGAGLVAVALAASGAVSAIFSPLLGQLADLRGRIHLMAAGLAVMALESLVVLLHPGTALTIVAFAIGGFGAPAYFNAFLSLIGDVTIPAQRGAVTGFVGSFGEWGSIIGSALAAPLLWRDFNSGAPLALDTAVFLIAMLFVIISRATLLQHLGPAVKAGEG